jgi:hypothetical protein
VLESAKSHRLAEQCYEEGTRTMPLKQNRLSPILTLRIRDHSIDLSSADVSRDTERVRLMTGLTRGMWAVLTESRGDLRSEGLRLLTDDGGWMLLQSSESGQCVRA